MDDFGDDDCDDCDPLNPSSAGPSSADADFRSRPFSSNKRSKSFCLRAYAQSPGLKVHFVAPSPPSLAAWIVVKATADAHDGFVQHRYVDGAEIEVDASQLIVQGENLATACLAGPVGIWSASAETIERLGRACAAAAASDGGAPLDNVAETTSPNTSGAITVPEVIAAISPASSASELHSLLVKAAALNIDENLAAGVKAKWEAETERIWPCCRGV